MSNLKTMYLKFPLLFCQFLLHPLQSLHQLKQREKDGTVYIMSYIILYIYGFFFTAGPNW